MATATGVGKDTLWTLIHEQRDHLADVLDTLDGEEWAALSLCAGWKVRDVVAHCIDTHVMTPARFAVQFAGAGFRFHTFSAKNVARHRDQSAAELLAEYRATAHRTTAPPGPKRTWLAEPVIHGEDIARPLGKQLQVSPAALVMVADFTRGTTPLLHGKQRSAGLRMQATDVEWSAGEGPEVRGPVAALILAMAGRGAALDDLSGDGVETLRSRI